MKTSLWLATAAAALIVGATFANAQTGREGGTGEGPATHNGATQGATKPTQGAPERKAGSHAGQAKAGPKASERLGEDQGKSSGQHPAAGQSESKEKGGQGQRGSRRGRGEGPQDKEHMGQGESKDRMGRGEGAEHMGQGETKQRATGRDSRVSVQISPQQRTRIRDVVIQEHSEARIDHPDFSVSVVALITRSVHVYTVPSEVVEIVPQYEGLDYIIVGDQIVILEPDTLRIVAINRIPPLHSPR